MKYTLDDVLRAEVFAEKAHEGQVRKYTGDPYIIHPLAVSDKMGSSFLKIVAVLHDVVEDTDVTFTQIEKEFGKDVMEGVWWLTDETTKGNRASRKHIQRLKLANAPEGIKLIKRADLIDNAKSIQLHDPSFWKVYKKEASALLLAMELELPLLFII